MKVLAGDIGGTSTHLLYAEVSTSAISVLTEMTYASGQYSSFDSLLRHFLDMIDNTAHIDSTCFAIAGPIHGKFPDQTVSVTNLPWEISSFELKKIIPCHQIHLINDFIGVAHSLERLEASDIQVIQQGNEDSEQPKMFIGAGTGLGLVHRIDYSLDGRTGYQLFAAEAGHSSFSPVNKQQLELMAYMADRNPYVANEDILSGHGLRNIYRFIRDTSGLPESSEIQRRFESEDPAAVITEAALKNSDPNCVITVNTFVQCYGAVVGNIALNCLPFGGIYIAGGIAPRIFELLNTSTFLSGFNTKGKMTQLMKDFRVNVIMNPNAGVIGASHFAALIR